MKAWEIAQELYTNAKPVILQEEDQTWEILKDVSKFYDNLVGLDWGSNVPGSGAPEKIMVAAVQAMENRGYIVNNSGTLLEEGLKAFEEKDFVKLHKISAELRYELLNAEKDKSHDYWKYEYYKSYDEYRNKIEFPESVEVNIETEDFRNKTKAAWLSQLVGAAMGTQVEGYTSDNLYKAFGEVIDYLREPNTYNDDITFELAFLEAFLDKGYNVTSKDIALQWVGIIPSGWSAEEFALRNIKAGIFPPSSGAYNNPFNEWIGAQMRGAICGMVAPGNPKLAAKLAWFDGEVSHANNGILGEVFNAVMVSLAYITTDVKDILRMAIGMIPSDSEYYSVINFAMEECLKNTNWKDALKACEEKYKKYNWIHAYPNACAEIIALYFGEGDFDKTLKIVTMAGIDVDCNAAQIMSVIGIQRGIDVIPNRLIHDNFNKIITYMRSYKEMSLDELVDTTIKSIQDAKTGGK